MKQKRVLVGNFFYTLTALSTGRILSLLDVIAEIQNGSGMDYTFLAMKTIFESFKKEHHDLADNFIQENFNDEALVDIFNDLLALSGLTQSEGDNKEPIKWDEIYAHISACTGWTPRQIDDDTTIDQIVALNKYYEAHPPIHILAAAYMGYKHKEPDSQSVDDFIANYNNKGQNG
jgi:hypothetical protein